MRRFAVGGETFSDFVAAALQSARMTSAGDWGLARRISFRFGVLLAGLLIFPFPVSVIPKADAVSRWLYAPLHRTAIWFGDHALGIPELFDGRSGSGDRTIDYVQLLMFALIAALGALVWSIADRKRLAYPRLAAAARVVLRYYLASELLSYGAIKVFRLQFSELWPGMLHERYGDSAPMRLLWSFMGYSAPYTVFAGAAEMVAGILLLWRRTTVLGALLAMVVMSNVVVLNFCYDVPVKLFSTQLDVFAVLLLLPDARRLIGAALGRSTAQVLPRPRMSVRRERIRWVGKYLVIACMAVSGWLEVRGRDYSDHIHELYGDWTVDRFVLDGVEHPPLTTDPVRWSAWTANAEHAGIWLMNGRLEPKRFRPIKVDAVKHTIEVTIEHDKPDAETWTYARSAPDRLVVDGPHEGHRLHLEPEGLLMTRGFRWINETPWNL